MKDSNEIPNIAPKESFALRFSHPMYTHFLMKALIQILLVITKY